MNIQLNISVVKQPTDTTCGPACLQSVYDYYQQGTELDQVISEVDMLQEGGTLACILGTHAIRRGFRAKIYTFNLHLFDPTWFNNPKVKISSKLTKQARAKSYDQKLVYATKSYLEFLNLGGALHLEDLTFGLIRRFLLDKKPIIVGLSATYLYKCLREIPATCKPDDIKGYPTGHFVVLDGINTETQRVSVVDPYRPEPNPFPDIHRYQVDFNHLISAILLGVVTYDANLLILELGREN